ncbi:hypothetical protein L228DRAFT_249912 [Xylona heveae TC161]|uniref:Pyoverdine/dityrosine biosynthesis protein n=1 Tax=Xylona heveae (strain CBS 132557 / TC161) TaxID=1328760 RepID=A0A165ABX1_XYLHT|nr:hypothetical protein L228DRAFT_249912 [Xylona heveae TC161]KZF20230.1 hypothetical protein L228DRAFT_249912 [Xylona heveae TC161]
MDFLSSSCSPVSVYHEIHAIYIRDAGGQSLKVLRGRQEPVERVLAFIFRNHPWSSSSVSLATKRPKLDPCSRDFSSDDQWVKDCIAQSCNTNGEALTAVSGFTLRLQEVPRFSDGIIFGLLSVFPQESGISPRFRQWFTSLVVNGARIPIHDLRFQENIDTNARYLSSIICGIFDQSLRNISRDDQWECGGRALFEDLAYRFISRGATVEFCLPAFPCKSSNTDKVTGYLPDKGEEIALKNLISFLRSVRKIYEPGAKLWVISDGHVFSDCIGVDDIIVDKYNEVLKSLCANILENEDALFKDCIQFCSLKELLFRDELRDSQFDRSVLSDITVSHFLGTTLSPDSELCRKILLAGCQVDSNELRAAIEDQDPARLALYRGFSKFMLEDLSLHSASETLSKSQRKKMSSKIAFEMIKRNHAYSNLVELLFPQHIRLSIHAHDNRGPKFGIRLLGKNAAKLERFDGKFLSSTSDDLLHIPTPWHNCVFQIEGGSTYYIAKSRVIREIMRTGQYKGVWTESQNGQGYFYLAPCEHL